MKVKFHYEVCRTKMKTPIPPPFFSEGVWLRTVTSLGLINSSNVINTQANSQNGRTKAAILNQSLLYKKHSQKHRQHYLTMFYNIFYLRHIGWSYFLFLKYILSYIKFYLRMYKFVGPLELALK